MAHYPLIYSISSGSLERADPSIEYDRDPRGFVWIYELPRSGATYKMGVDPTIGRTGWNRAGRVKEDRKTNNGSIQIIRVGRDFRLDDGTPTRTPDVQVCEYAAPIDAIEIGFVANILGRVYAGRDEDQCEAILEVTGPGSLTIRQLVELGYVNLWRWQYYADLVPGTSRAVGWNASPKTLRDLWAKTSRHINLKRTRIYSPFLVEEYASCIMDPVRGYPISPSNESGHGDRMRAYNLALWAGNKWDTDVERTSEPVQTQQVKDYQLSDMSWEDIQADWGDRLYNY